MAFLLFEEIIRRSGNCGQENIAVRLKGNKKVQNLNEPWYEDVAQPHTTQGDLGLEPL